MSLFNCFGIRFGWSSVIGIVPGIGDVIDAFMAMMVLRTCQQVEGGLPASVKSKMMFNIVLDFGIGLVPFLGDIADALFRANTRNAVELEKHLREKGARTLKAQGHNALPYDPTDPDEFDRQMREEHGAPPQYTTGAPSRQDNGGRAPPQPARPEPAANRGGSWFNRPRQADVERGQGGPLTSSPSDEPRRNKSTLQKNRY
jgi:hypothetical protein